MKQKTADAHKEISEERHDKDGIVAMFPAANNACVGKVHEKKVGESIDYFSGVRCSIVVLENISTRLPSRPEKCIPLHTNSEWKSPEPNSLPREDRKETKVAKNTCFRRSIYFSSGQT